MEFFRNLKLSHKMNVGKFLRNLKLLHEMVIKKFSKNHIIILYISNDLINQFILNRFA